MPISYMFPGADQLDEQTRQALMGQSAVAMGAQMLQAGGQGKSTAEALGMGLQSGLGSLTRSQQVAMENAMRRQQMEMAQSQEEREQQKYESAMDRLERQQQFWHSMDPKGKESTQGTSPGAPTPGSMTPQGIVPQMQQGQFQPSMETGVRALAAGVDPSTAQMLMPNMGQPQDTQLKKVQGPDGNVYYMPERQAIGMQAPQGAEGRWTMSTPDAFGTRYWYHTGTGERRKVGGEQVGGETTQVGQPGAPGVDMTQVTPNAVGPISGARAFMNNAFGWMKPGGTFFPKEADARQQARIFSQQGMGLLTHETSRLSNWEQERARELFPNPDQFWQDPDVALNNLYRLRGFLQQKIQMNQRAMQSLPQKEALEYKVANENLQQLIQMADPPTPNFGEMGKDNLRRYAEALSGEAVQAMTEQERQALIQALEENDL